MHAGVNFVLQPNLPAATIWLQDLEVDIVGSSFQELSAAAQGSILLTRTTASFQDTHFLNNVQSGAGLLKRRLPGSARCTLAPVVPVTRPAAPTRLSSWYTWCSNKMRHCLPGSNLHIASWPRDQPGGVSVLLLHLGHLAGASSYCLIDRQCALSGALIATDSDVSFQDCTFMNNTGYQSGAINLAGGSLTVNGSVFINNSGPQVLAFPTTCKEHC